MAIAGRQFNSTRDRYDFYPTDPAWVKVLLKHVTATNIVTNAPFRGAFGMVDHWLRITTGKVALLTAASFLESKARGRFFTDHPPNLVAMVCKRMNVFDKPSQFPHVWIVWDNENRPSFTTLKWETHV